MDVLLQKAIELGGQSCPPYIPVPGRVAYLVNHGQNSAGDSHDVHRTRGIVTALENCGLKVSCQGHPGQVPSLDVAVAQLEGALRSNRPEKILVVSDAAVGLPAWIVAQRLNLPFYVEVRTFPELERDARQPGYAQTPDFDAEQACTNFIARHADKVFTLCETMKGELAGRGVDPQRIELVPSGFASVPVINPSRHAVRAGLGFAPATKVIGCDGRSGIFEDLDTLVEACIALISQGEDIRLILVGDNPAVTLVQEKASAINEGSWLIQTTESLEENLVGFLALIDVQVIPYRTFPVCELVPPVSVALVHGTRLVVSNAAALVEYAGKYDGVTVYESGSTPGLVQALRKALEGAAPTPSADLLLENSARTLCDCLKSRSAEAGLSVRAMDLAAGWESCEAIFSAEGNYRGRNTREIIDQVLEQYASGAEAASELTRLARIALPKSHEVAVKLALEAVRLDPKPFRIKWLGFLLFDAGQVAVAKGILDVLPPESMRSPEEIAKANYINGCARLLLDPPRVAERSAAPPYEPIANKVLYVASSARPYHFNGYTSRTHGVVKGLLCHGWDVLCVTRPGYPADRADRAGDVEVSYAIRELDGVLYQALPGPHRRSSALDRYLYASANIIAEKAKEERVAVIHAASNYEAALPALLAARRLGIRFVYEVRGLWEYTAASRMPGWESTERFRLDEMLESIVVRHADRVVTLTAPLANELVRRGGDADKVVVAPNAIDPEEFTARERNGDLAYALGLSSEHFVVGYAGSIVSYEGLDDLLSAFPALLARCPSARLLLVGDGYALAGLKSQSVQLGIDDKVVFAGRVKPEEVPDYLSLMSVIVLPRKAFRVCELVSPLKPFEAMAMKIPLLVSSVEALREIARDGETAFVFNSGCSRHLADVLEQMSKDPVLVQDTTVRAYAMVNEGHTWSKVALLISSAYSGGRQVSMCCERACVPRVLAGETGDTVRKHFQYSRR